MDLCFIFWLRNSVYLSLLSKFPLQDSDTKCPFEFAATTPLLHLICICSSLWCASHCRQCISPISEVVTQNGYTRYPLFFYLSHLVRLFMIREYNILCTTPTPLIHMLLLLLLYKIQRVCPYISRKYYDFQNQAHFMALFSLKANFWKKCIYSLPISCLVFLDKDLLPKYWGVFFSTFRFPVLFRCPLLPYLSIIFSFFKSYSKIWG